MFAVAFSGRRSSKILGFFSKWVSVLFVKEEVKLRVCQRPA